VEDLPRSVHGAEGVDCADCHGGRPDEPTARAHDRAAGFRARVAAGAEPEVCGDCHARIVHGASEEFGVPLDPLARYQGSVHGKARAAGNARAAICAACHGAHDIHPAADPRSPVARERVATTCARCHADPALAGAFGLPHDQFAQWQRSVHGQAFAREQAQAASGPVIDSQTRAPTCNDCHDDHAVRERDHAVSGCRGCHGHEWKAFSSGPHAAAFERMGFVPCVDCHGSHEVSLADGSLIGVDAEAACRRCHAKGQPQFERIVALGGEVRAAQAAAQRARESIEAPVAKAARLLGGLDAAEAALGQAVHALKPERIAAAARQLRERAAAVPVASPEPAGWFGVPQGELAMVVLLAVLGAAALLLALAAGRRGRP
jgi:hypothetical protein